jgi:ribonuclease H2 subunit C
MSTKIVLNASSTEKETTVHVLPCHIAYDGHSKVSQYFQPRTDPVDQTVSTATFRGRKLAGRTVSLPKGYTGSLSFVVAYSGHVFRPTDSTVGFDRAKYGDEDDDEDDDEGEKVAWQTGEKFDKLTVWEHHTLPDGKQDHWIRGIEEWIGMAEVVHQAPYRG